MEQRKQIKKNTKQEQNLPLNVKINVPLIDIARNNVGSYNRAELLKIINQVPWGKISIPLYSYRNLIIDTDEHGHMVVGYISGYETETETFELTIFGRCASIITEFVNPVIYPRIIITDKKEMIITAFDVTPKNVHSKLYKMEKLSNMSHNK